MSIQSTENTTHAANTKSGKLSLTKSGLTKTVDIFKWVFLKENGFTLIKNFAEICSWLRVPLTMNHHHSFEIWHDAEQARSHYLKQLWPVSTALCDAPRSRWVNWDKMAGIWQTTLKYIFLNKNARISLKISQKLVPKVRLNTIPALVQIMAWRRSGDKPLSEPMMVSLLTHICVTRPRWVKKCQSCI